MNLPSAALRGFHRIALAALLMPLAGHATLAAEISVIAGDRIEVEGRDFGAQIGARAEFTGGRG